MTPRRSLSVSTSSTSAGWWFKTVQLDLEAKHQIVRGRTSPIRIHQIRRRRFLTGVRGPAAWCRLALSAGEQT